MSAQTPPTKAPPSPVSSKPVDILQDQSSQLYANVHPALLVLFLLATFPTLVKDPVSTLSGLALFVAVLQALYCVLCLPYSGNAPTTPHKPGQKRKPTRSGQETWARIVVRHNSHCTAR